MKKLVFVFISVISSFSVLAQTHGTVIPMDSIQYVDTITLNSGKTDPVHFKYGDTVTIEGIVTFNPIYYGQSTNRKATWLQDTIFKPFGAMNVFIEPAMPGYSGNLGQLNNEVKFYENFLPGYRVKCTGILADYTENTQLNLIPIESEIIDIPSSIDTSLVVKPIELTIDNFMKNDGSGGQLIMRRTGEQYEGYFVQFNNVTVVDVSASGSRYYWSVQDSAGNKIQIRDNSGYFRNDHKEDAAWVKNYVFTPPTIGTQLSYIRGIIVQSSSTLGNVYMISPCLPTDIKVAAAAPFIDTKNKYPAVPTSAQSVKIRARIKDNDGFIQSAKLYYSVGFGNKNFTSVNMTKDGATDFFEGIIPPAPNGEYVNYWIRAIDNNGLITNSPDTLATGSVYRVLDNGIKSISDIQETPLLSGSSVFNGDTITNCTIGGVVTATLQHFPFIAIQDGTKPYSAIFIKASAGDGLANLKQGDSIVIKNCKVIEDFNITYLTNCGNNNFELISRNNPLPSPVKLLYPDSVALKNPKYGEPYECMLLQFDNVYVVSLNPDAPGGNFGEWSFSNDSNSTTGLRVDDLSSFLESNFNTDSLTLGQKLDYLKGLLYYSFGNWKMLPRTKFDIAGYYSDTVTHSLPYCPANNFIHIYPNPTSDMAIIEGNSSSPDNISCTVYDINGRVQYSLTTCIEGDFRISLPVNTLTSGCYFVKISGNSIDNQIFRLIKF